ncbi:MAG: glycine betaine ABC transporter substrate-binding protein [Actinomycetes bacterium]
MIRKKKGMKAAVISAAVALTLTACGGGVDAASTAGATSAAPEACGSYAIAMHAWVGYTASAQVLTNIGNKMGCTITQTQLDEGAVTYDAMEAGTIDLIVEDWGGGRWKDWADRGAVVDLGPDGNIGLIGMYVPQWMADKYPDITDSANLNKYADLFKTPESKGKGAWLEGPPGYTTIGEKLVKENKLNFTVLSQGSESALIDAFTKADKDQTAVLAYWWTPQNLLAKIKLARINFPANDWTDAAAASGLTDYPETVLPKLAGKKLAESTDPFGRLVKNWKWTNDDQNAVAADIDGGMTPEAAAQKWIDANADQVAAWTK